MPDKNNFKRVAVQSAQEAGKVLMKHFGKLSRANIQTKSKHEIVTPADLAAEKIILKNIKKNFPSHRILSEEKGKTGAKDSEYLWVVDPLDGTTNFSIGNPLFSVSIALLKDDKVILGVIYVPFLNNLYLSEKTKGAFLNNKKIKVSQENKIENAMLTFCHGNTKQSIDHIIDVYKKFKLDARDMRQLGSAAIECAWVAQGKVEAIIIPGVNIWDVAAGALIIREAGGKVTDMNGQEWNLNSKGIIASNEKINNILVKSIKKLK